MRITVYAAAVALALPFAAAADGPRFEPGLWKMTVHVSAIDMPSAPPGMVASMLASPTTITRCFTAEQIAKSPEAIFKPGSACSFSRFTMSGGRIDEAAVCKMPGGTMTINSTGTFTPTTFTVAGTSSATGRMASTTTSTTTGTRVGPCP